MAPPALDQGPRASVVLPVFNGERFIASAVQSILAQTMADLECIVVDDGSQDGTADILSRIHDQRLRVERHQRNSGLVRSLNHGVSLARSSHVARMDADDVAYPARLERQLSYLAAHPGTGLVGSGVEFISDAGEPIAPRTMVDDDLLLRWRLLFWNHFIHPSMVFRREWFEAVGGYRPEAYPAEDYDLWLRMAELGEIGNVVEPLVQKRTATGSLTDTRAPDQMAAAARSRQEALSSLLGEDVDLSVVISLDAARFATCAELDAALGLVRRAARAMARRVDASARQRLLLLGESAVVVERFRLRDAGGRRCPRAVARSFPVAQLVPLRRAVRRLRRTVALPSSSPSPATGG